MVHHAQAETSEEIARLLRSRGRIVITAPRRIGKTTELLKYAEERFPNGRFAIVAKEQDHAYIIKLHWCIYNGFSHVDVVAKRLLGEELEGEDVMTPQLLTPESAMFRVFNASTPTFCDQWNCLPSDTQRVILKRRLFIAAVSSIEGESTDAEED